MCLWLTGVIGCSQGDKKGAPAGAPAKSSGGGLAARADRMASSTEKKSPSEPAKSASSKTTAAAPTQAKKDARSPKSTTASSTVDKAVTQMSKTKISDPSPLQKSMDRTAVVRSPANPAPCRASVVYPPARAAAVGLKRHLVAMTGRRRRPSFPDLPE